MRKPMSKKLRFEVFKRDLFICQYCGAHPPVAILEVDHIDPVANGGTDRIDNLITSCVECNRGKGARLLTVTPKSLGDHAKEVKEREAQIDGYRKIIQASLDRIDEDAREVGRTLCPESINEGISRDWFKSIKMFNSKLPLHVVIEAAEIARDEKGPGKNRFLYFCGICWTRVRSGEYGPI